MAQGLAKFVRYKGGFVISSFLFIYFTITGVKKTVRYIAIDDFVV